MRSVRAVAWIWCGAGVLLAGLAIHLVVELAEERGEGFTDIALLAFLFCLFGFVAGLLIAVSRSVQRYGKFGWLSIIMFSAQGAVACAVLAYGEVDRVERLAAFVLGAILCLFSLWVLLAKEVRTRVWQGEIARMKKRGQHQIGGVPVLAVLGSSAYLVSSLLRDGGEELLPPGAMRWILAGLLLISACGPIPFLYWKRNQASKLLGILGGICLFAYFLVKVGRMYEAASWTAILELELFVFTAGVVAALAVFHMAIHLFDQERADATGSSYTMLVLVPAMICSGFAAMGDAGIAVVVLTTSGALFLYSLYAPPWEYAPGSGRQELRIVRIGHAAVVGAYLAWELSLSLFLAPVALVGLAAVQVWGIRKRIDGAGILSVGVAGYLLTEIWSLFGRELHSSLAFLYGTVIFTGSMSIFIARRFVRTLADNARKTQELEEARRLQLSLLPEEVPDAPHIEVAWHMDTATEVGGDYYDYSLAEDGTLTLCVGDATGHGMNSGVVVTGTKSLFRTFADAPSITDSLQVMSKSLKEMNLPRMGMAMTLFRAKGSSCIVSSAGMPPVMIYRAASGDVEEIEVAGFPLGVSASATYREESFELSPDDVVLMMSDGLPERLNPQDEYFDYDRTKALFGKAATGTPEEICEALLQGGEEWAEGRPQDDDITLVVLKAR